MNELDEYLDYYNDKGFNKMQKWFGKYYENLIIIAALTVVLILSLDL